jgi:hypothetical protein
MATNCNAGGHCETKNRKYNPFCDKDQQVISAAVNEELICDSDDYLDLGTEEESARFCAVCGSGGI